MLQSLTSRVLTYCITISGTENNPRIFLKQCCKLSLPFSISMAMYSSNVYCLFKLQIKHIIVKIVPGILSNNTIICFASDVTVKHIFNDVIILNI